ncbi:ABC transporter permease [Rhizobium sp. BK602]|uniref:ABC transporter permease n=1 Tax=Rhizobium sp. BK602 TaxID=2586986 RepID=UPI0016147B4F|nr:ABC transporter permease [Rhizobium sp. BK602]MBB3612528.1 NitT/TauT family transport system permease protein [Rhizobium sp. BK602]
MMKRLFQNLAVPVVLLIVWQLMSVFGLVRPEILPSPVAILERFWLYLAPEQSLQEAGGLGAWVMSSELLGDLLASLQRVVLGFVVGAGLALPLGLLMGTDRTIERYLNPVIQFLRPIPPIAYIPLAILWFGLGNPPAIFLIAIGAFFPVLINTISGVRNVDSIYVRAATNLGADRLTLFRRVILPAATPYILTGMRIGIGTAFIVVIVAEMIAVNSGLGYRILEAREYMWSDKVIAGMIAIGLLGLAIDLGVNRLNSHLLRWHRGIES